MTIEENGPGSIYAANNLPKISHINSTDI